MTPPFPTLAEQLAHGPPPREADPPLVVLLECAAPPLPAAPVLPPTAVTASLGEFGLDGLLRVVRSTPGDVLLVSDPELVTPRVVAALQSVLAIDSACTSVSLDPAAAPSPPAGLPPPGIDSPRAGLVLVRRVDLVLALDEVDRSETGGGPVFSQFFALLHRPGFVHRLLRPDAREARPSAPYRRRRPQARDSEIVLDGDCLAHPLTGTQVQTLELAAALARAGVKVAVMRPGKLHPTAVSRVQALGNQIAFVERGRFGQPDIFHRPFQITSLHDLADRIDLAHRFVLTHQDMIWDRTRGYHTDDAKRDYRAATHAALGAADEVGFFSYHAAIDAASDGAVDLDRATVVWLGVDHLQGREIADTVAPPLGGRPYLLMVGSSFWHKNRVFSLRLVEWLVRRQGWEGGLVLVGGHPGGTSSRTAERDFLEHAAALSGRVADLGYVPEPEQMALYRDAELVLFPTLYEGFGFVPFEAAALGTAPVYANRSAMAELLPAEGMLPSFDLDEAGAFVAGLLSSIDARSRLVEAISETAAELTWDRTALGYRAVYDRALGRPRRELGDLLQASLELTRRTQLTQREASLLAIYRRRRSARLAADSIVHVGTKLTSGMRTILGRQRTG